ncbi:MULTISPECIES: hypothetical protein [unclassified Solwaraspora]|uniref:hypothetical protein n=1 Tax=unclassified Solwaraspora TaxID=2627926 RepID=UPI00259B8192|nr:hypothetical protein [Solwaraspora sp. WMMA2056]WJK41553.1 hypothetical protein O7608_03740 [Solwaraspora sp. WMMA2056]
MTKVGDDVRDDEWLAAAAPRRWTNRVTPWLAAAALLAAGFAAGVAVPRDTGGTVTGAGQRQFGAGGLPGRADAAGQSGRADAAGAQATPTAAAGQPATATAAATGTVKLVDGATVYVETGTGAVVIVRTDDGTAVRVPGDLTGLTVGTAVTVEGETASDGTVTAASIVAGD